MKDTFAIIDREPCIVGECPLWDERRQLLYTVDIRGRRIREYSFVTGAHREFRYSQEIGCIALTESGRLLAAMTDGIYIAHEDGSLTPVCVPESLKGRRFNDGKVGPDGRFYVGTTDNSHQGAFYRLDTDGTLTELFDRVGCSNGLAWSADGKTLYYCDSPTRTLEAFDFSSSDGSLSHRRSIMRVPWDTGEFDGMTIDTEGMLWIAVWGSYRAFRIDPDRGAVLQTAELPVSRVSCCAFAGADCSTLILTTAAYQADPALEPLAGSTFAQIVPVSGRPSWRWQGD